MRFTIIPIFLFLTVVTACNAEGKREDAIQYLKERKYHLRRAGDGLDSVKVKGEIYSVTAKEIDVTEKDLRTLCELGTVEVLFFRNSQLAQGAIRGLEGCDKLEYISYEEGATLPLEEIPDHDRIQNLNRLAFSGKVYGDTLMPYLGQLKKVPEIVIAGDSVEVGGSITDEGVRRFVEAHTGSEKIRLDFTFQHKISDKAFEYLLNVKGLEYLEFGPRSEMKVEMHVTREGASRFAKEYKEKYGYFPKVITDHY